MRHIGVELGRCALERLEDSALDLDNRLVETLSYLLIGDADLAWQGVHQVGTGDDEVLRSVV